MMFGSSIVLLFGLFTTFGHALQPLDLEQAKVLTAVYDAYIAQNLSYDCFRYADRNEVAECDCLACISSHPLDAVQRLCRFRKAQKDLSDAAGDVFLSSLQSSRKNSGIWRAMCDPKCSQSLPSKCCDPAAASVPRTDNGCPTCLPTLESGSTVGQHASCILAEAAAGRKVASTDLNWLEKYARFAAAMDRAQLSRKCISYALVRTANTCDCEPCLQSESTTRELRAKLCEYGRLVRATKELLRPDFWGHNDYFLKFCDFEACPEMPRKCCEPHDGGESRDGRYPVDGNGCPACLPTSELFGYGPACQRKFKRLPATVRDRIVSHL